MGGIGGQGKIKVMSASTPSANEPAKYLVLVHTVQLKPAQISGIMVSNGISEVATALVSKGDTLRSVQLKIGDIIKYMQFQFIARACHTQRALLQR